jgi:hypothetical protein
VRRRVSLARGERELWQIWQPELREKMSYRISYDDTMPLSIKKWRDQERAYTETFETEHEALNRARQLLDDADVRAVSVADDRGDVLGGIRLQLKLGFTAE